MATKCGSGFSYNRNPEIAAKEAINKAMQSAGAEKCDIVILFSTIGYQHEILIKTLSAITDNAKLIGCTGEGAISFDFNNESPFALSIMIIQSDELTFEIAKVTGVKTDCEKAGKKLGESITPFITDKTMSIWIFPDHLSMNYDAFLSSFESSVSTNHHIPIFGGGSADNWQFKQMFQFHNNEVLTDSVVCLVITGTLSVASAITHGCIPIGIEREVTKSQGNTILEIDNRKVTDVLQEYIPEEDVANWHKLGIRCLCLGLKAPGTLKNVYDEYIIRAMPVVDFATGSGRVSTELKPGTKIHMISRNPEKLLPNAELMAQDITRQLNGAQPKFVLQIDCAGRSKVLRTEEKMIIQKKLQSFVKSEVPWTGLYCYGEMGPVAGKNYFHNFTVIIAAFY
ncbi:MAG: FIST C-terminal domain-containing protein [Chitinispirillaceae bacterium]|nr:FIST C-terminal domain-containing protein [Chitinispirillaceae bacterium]